MRDLPTRAHGSVSVLALVCMTAGLGWSVPALAQDSEVAALDQLSERSSDVTSALALSREQAAAGDLLGAAATLERVLIADENADDARLAYAAILCRLDDRQSAQLELRSLSGQGGSAEARAEMVTACGAGTAVLRGKSGFSGQIGVGLAYDQDALGELRAFTFLIPIPQDGLAFVANANISGRFGEGADFFYTDLWAQNKNNLAGPDSDYQIGALSLGYGTGWSNKEIKIGGIVRHGRIFGTSNFTEYGGELEFSASSANGTRNSVRAEAVWQHTPLGFGDGMHYDLAAYHDVRSSERLSWFIGVGAELKNAQLATQKYVAGRVTAGVELVLDDRGTYANFATTMRYVDFGDDLFQPVRKDLRLYNRFAIGVPLGRSGLNLEAAVTHSLRNYSQTSFIADYDSFGGALSLIWKFGNRRGS